LKATVKRAWIIGVVLALACCAATVVVLLNPPGPDLICHKQIDGAIDQWMIESTNTVFPNVHGNSAESIAAFNAYLAPGHLEIFHDYRYVPGLKPGDPEDLILLYTTSPSRRRWHGDMKWIGEPKKWIVVNAGRNEGHHEPWEMNEGSEALTTEQFTNRLQKTLAYLGEHNRPYWTNIVDEHDLKRFDPSGFRQN
jgi:hypothetical protein